MSYWPPGGGREGGREGGRVEGGGSERGGREGEREGGGREGGDYIFEGPKENQQIFIFCVRFTSLL